MGGNDRQYKNMGAEMSIALSTNPVALEGSRLLLWLSQQTGGKGLATLITQQPDTRKI